MTFKKLRLSWKFLKLSWFSFRKIMISQKKLEKFMIFHKNLKMFMILLNFSSFLAGNFRIGHKFHFILNLAGAFRKKNSQDQPYPFFASRTSRLRKMGVAQPVIFFRKTQAKLSAKWNLWDILKVSVKKTCFPGNWDIY